MLARFEKAGGGEDDRVDAGYPGALSGLTITRRPEADPEERAEDDEDGDA